MTDDPNKDATADPAQKSLFEKPTDTLAEPPAKTPATGAATPITRAPKPRTPRAAPSVRKPATKTGTKATGARITASKTAAKPRADRVPARRALPEPVRPSGMRLAIIVATVILILDQLSKYIVVHALNLKEISEITVWEPWLNLRMAWNQGVNFGLFSSDVEMMRWILVGVSLVICVWVAVWMWRARPGRFAGVAAGLLIGGALGNVVDRVAYGAVADFLNMSLPTWRNPYSFNVADIAIFAGAIGLVLLPSRDPEVPAEPGPLNRSSGRARDKTRDGGGKTR